MKGSITIERGHQYLTVNYYDSIEEQNVAKCLLTKTFLSIGLKVRCEDYRREDGYCATYIIIEL